MPVGDAAKIRRHTVQLVQVARSEGEARFNIRVGDVRDELGLDYSDAAIDICQVLETGIFRDQARVEFIGKSGPRQGVNTTYRLRIL